MQEERSVRQKSHRCRNVEYTDWAKFPLENPNPVMRTDREGEILIANPACAGLLAEWGSTAGGRLPERMAGEIADSFRQRKSRILEVECRGRVYSFFIVPIVKSGYVNLYGTDITERLEMQKALKQSRDELERRVQERTAELETVNRTLQAEIAERKQMQQQLHALSTMLVTTEERERRRIATDLHDRIIQNLVYANIKLGELREHSVKTASSTAEDIYQSIQQTIHDLRTLTFELSPPVLYELGFVPAVKWLIRQFGEKYGIALELREDGIPAFIQEELRIVLFQALRELLTNAIKHARASTIQVGLYRDRDDLRIIVEDDGIGFDSSMIRMNRKDNTGFGLFNIRQRLESVQGKMTTQSSPDVGTRFEIIVPLFP